MKTFTHYFYVFDVTENRLQKYYCNIVERSDDPNITTVVLGDETTQEVITKRLIRNYHV